MYLIILAFAIAIVFALLLLVFKKTGRKRPANFADSNHTPYPFRLIAIGMVLAFLPTAFGLIVGIFKPILIHIVWYQYLLGIVCQAFGSFLMALGFLYMYRWSNSHPRVPKSGFVLGVIGSCMGLMVNSLIVLMEIMGGAFVSFYMAIFTIATIIMAVACFRLSSCYTRFRGLGAVFVILTLAVLLIDYGPLSYYNSDSYYEVYQFFWIIIDFYDSHGIFALGVALVLLAVTVFGLRLAWAKPKAGNAAAPKENMDYRPAESSQAPATATSTAADGDILEKLKGYDDVRLRKIVDNPKFHSAAVVDKARELLARREAWEQIKDLPDEELLEMTMADKGLYEPNIVEAASMELYQRDSRLLREQFMALTPDTLSAIASGTAPAPEGIRLAAQKYLSKSTRP